MEKARDSRAARNVMAALESLAFSMHQLQSDQTPRTLRHPRGPATRRRDRPRGNIPTPAVLYGAQRCRDAIPRTTYQQSRIVLRLLLTPGKRYRPTPGKRPPLSRSTLGPANARRAQMDGTESHSLRKGVLSAQRNS